MTLERADDMRQAFDPLLPATLMLQAIWLWQMPLILGATWWNSLLPGCPSHTAFGRHETHHDEHHQLVVPGPLEDGGEHLVA